MSIILPYDEEPQIAVRYLTQASGILESGKLSCLSVYDEVLSASSEEDFIKSATQSGFFKRKIDKTELFIPHIPPTTPLSVYKRRCDQYYSAPLDLVSEVFDNHLPKFKAKGYGMDEVNLYYFLEALCGPPFVDLTQIILDNNHFGKSACVPLSNYLLDSTVKILSLKGCGIGAEGIAELADCIKASTKMKYLNLSQCDLRDDGGVIIAKAMSSNRSITNLDLSCNKMYTVAAAEIGEMVVLNRTIQILNLRWNDFYTEEASCLICKGMQSNLSINNFDFSWNGLIGTGFAKEMISYLKKTRFLRILNLENNCLSHQELVMIAEALQKCVTLKECYMGGNRWSTKAIALVLIGKYTSLQTFSFGDQGLEGILYDLARIFMLKPNKKIIFGGKILPNPPVEFSFNNIVFDRMKLVAMKQKKKKFQRNMGHFMYLLLDEGADLILETDYDRLYAEFNAKLDEPLAKHLKELYLTKVGKLKYVEAKNMAREYLARHPTVKPPPKIKVEPPPLPPPPPPAQKKKK